MFRFIQWVSSNQHRLDSSFLLDTSYENQVDDWLKVNPHSYPHSLWFSKVKSPQIFDSISSGRRFGTWISCEAEDSVDASRSWGVDAARSCSKVDWWIPIDRGPAKITVNEKSVNWVVCFCRNHLYSSFLSGFSLRDRSRGFFTPNWSFPTLNSRCAVLIFATLFYLH